MELCDLIEGQSACVTAVDAPDPLRARLGALGVKEGDRVTRVGGRHGTVLLQAGTGLLALGKETAKCVRVRLS